MAAARGIFIGLGSNLGDRLANLQQALHLLEKGEGKIRITSLSPLYETVPQGGPPQGPFLNACAGLNTNLTPVLLLKRLLAVENLLGRVRQERWGPRLIDLDLLVYGNKQLSTDLLELPHLRLLERDFVLVPLTDIAPGLKLPDQALSLEEILASRPANKEVRPFADENWWKGKGRFP